jgi:hypothetical protein
MKRRDFLAGTLPLTLCLDVPAALTSTGRAPRACIVTGDFIRPPDVVGVFEELGIGYDVVGLGAAETADGRRYSLLWITSPEYPYHTELSPRMVATIEAFLDAGRGVFAEFTLNFPGVPAAARPQKTGIARLFVSSPLDTVAGCLPAGTILDEHDSICLPLTGETRALRDILSFGKVKGVERVMEVPATDRTWPGVVWGERASGRFAVATTSISDFRRREYAPLAHWQGFLRDLVLALLSPKERAAVSAAYIPITAYTEPRVWVLPNSPLTLVVETRTGLSVTAAGAQTRETTPGRFEFSLGSGPVASRTITSSVATLKVRRKVDVGVRVAARKDAYRRALDRNIGWFERSGALLSPDGSRGVSEWISGPDINGNRIPYGKGQMFSPERADCVFQSGLAFRLYGEVAASERHRGIGGNLLRSILDLQRLDRDDARYGLWYTRGRSGPPYQDDIAWSTIGCFAGNRYTKRPILYHRGTLSAAASVKAFQTGGKNGLALAGAEDDPYPHPHDRGQLLASWLYAYGSTGDKTYLDIALPLVEQMIERFPTIPRFLISRTEESVRFLLPLALAYVYTGSAAFRDEMRKQTDYIVACIAPCGAIQEHGSNAGSKVGGGDLGLTYDANETISDQLYTTSFAVMNLWIAYKATSDKAYLDTFERVMDYLVRIQIENASKPTIDGGWMRGFDYGLWEYYGSNADESWTAYCMETGWMNAIIDIALSLYLLDDTFYPTAHAVHATAGMPT